MIPFIDPVIGIKDDPPKTTGTQSGSGDFSRVLGKATGTAEARQSKSIRSADASAHSRRREIYSSRSGESPEAPPEQQASRKPRTPQSAQDQTPARDGETMLDQATESLKSPHLQYANNPETVLNDELLGIQGAGEILTDLKAKLSVGAIEEMNPAGEQIGQAAWSMGEHGKGEQQIAESMGIVFPGSPEAELSEASKGVSRDMAFQEAHTVNDDAAALAAAGQLSNVVMESKEAKKEFAQGVPFNDQVHLEAAQGRNELLGKLAAIEAGAEGEVPDSTLARNAFLREQMQQNALLSNKARTAVVDSVEGKTPLSLAELTGPASAMNFRQIYESPADPAVQQRVVDRVAHEARWLISNQRQQVTFRLHPEQLGSLHMKIVREDGVVRIDMIVDTLAAKELLESNLDSLRDQLGEGNSDGEFLFNVDVRQGNDQPELHARTASGGMAPADHPDSLEGAADPNLTRRVLGHGGLSIYA